jgi:hypothetical protein
MIRYYFVACIAIQANEYQSKVCQAKAVIIGFLCGKLTFFAGSQQLSMADI